jgi:hypothetical protein
MQRHPIESNFYVSVSDTEIEVTFAPTRSLYTFSRATSESFLPDPVVRHLGKKGNTGDYEPTEVQAMARRVASATMKRLRVRHTVIQLWPCESREIELAKARLAAA